MPQGFLKLNMTYVGIGEIPELDMLTRKLEVELLARDWMRFHPFQDDGLLHIRKVEKLLVDFLH